VTLGIPHPRVVRWSPRMLWKARHMIAYQFPKRAARGLRRDDFAEVAALYRRWSPSWSLPEGALDEVKAAYRKPGVVEGALGPYAATRVHIKNVYRRLAAPIEVPTLALFGDEDPSVPRSFYARAASSARPTAGRRSRAPGTSYSARTRATWRSASSPSCGADSAGC
jgi:pimeloyl-ACP methyl ester carboxylesterase